MLVVHSSLHALHDGGMELHRGALVPSFEMPARVEYIEAALRRAGHEFIAPMDAPVDTLQRVHEAAYVDFLRTAYARWLEDGHDGFMLPSGFPARSLRQDRVPTGINGAMGHYAFDAGTPIVAGTWEAAHAAARCAITAAARVGAGARAAYALCRPPGHHAGRSVYGGYCYLNNAALAAQELRDRGARRVALLDVDYHHGNGTQDIYWERDDVLFVSIHGTPETEYPYFLGYADERGAGAGAGHTLNLPLPRGTTWSEYRVALDVALAAIARYSPDAMVVSLGVDTYAGDPISAFALTTADFSALGTRLAELALPTVLVQEGGYAIAELGDNVAAVLAGFA
jgi:acetoin utilization deacetylase AcuC-like enzyme